MAPGIFRGGADYSDEGARIQLKGYWEWKISEEFIFPDRGVASSDEGL